MHQKSNDFETQNRLRLAKYGQSDLRNNSKMFQRVGFSDE